jgi:hypothetical protein
MVGTHWLFIYLFPVAWVMGLRFQGCQGEGEGKTGNSWVESNSKGFKVRDFNV